jgi:phosphoribosylamine--glycine ligase
VAFLLLVVIFAFLNLGMNILIIGSGGREHAFAWKIKQSALCTNLYVAPGNAGTALLAENIAVGVEEFDKIKDVCLQKKIDLVVVGPEVPLVAGIVNYFEQDSELKKIWIVGPGKEGAQLEGSKDFSKQFMVRHQVPTAKARTFHANELTQAVAYLETCTPPIVLKADGLAAGKGVIISSTVKEAQSEITEMLEHKKFGSASAKVLIEEFLDGIELSVFVLTDGNSYVILPEAKDYKRIGDNDKGSNTGGMGAVSPVVFADASFMKKVEEKVVIPTINGLKKEKIPFKGFVFVGLMNVKGEPYVIEYNVRMGDPETEVVLPRIETDLVSLLVAAAKGELKDKTLRIKKETAVTVVLASGGYPDAFEKGKLISGLPQDQYTTVFHAGTKEHNGQVVTNGGRVLVSSGLGSTLAEAIKNAYSKADPIQWEGKYNRTDIGQDLLKIETSA